MASQPDLVIRGGNIADGSGGDLFEADVAVTNGRITEVGKIAGRGKEEAAASLYRGVEDESWPVTGLLRHSRVTVIDAGVPAALP